MPEGGILGVRHGFRGFSDRARRPIVLTKEGVDRIHLEGGTVLGTGSDRADVQKIVRHLDMLGVDLLFIVGGQGAHAAAEEVRAALRAAGVLCAVVGIPKSIDNAIMLVDRCFGFDSAVEEAQRALLAAKTEALSVARGVGVVKLMGRQSGWIALNSAMASGVVDVCLIPEVPFRLDGPSGLLAYLDGVLSKQGHAVVCVAEGAGQELADRARRGGGGGAPRLDAAGNAVLADVGTWLRDEVKAGLRDVELKYIDPSASGL